jgi:two-component system sensor histidine kinase UhpB
MKQRVFVVDDDPDLREAIVHVLETKGYEVSGFAKGQDALTAIKDNPPVVVLVDLMLDDMPGVAVMTRTKELSPHTQCVVLTAFASVESAVASVNLGAFSYLEKPCDKDRLLLAIRGAADKASAEMLLDETERRCRRVAEASGNLVMEIGADMKVLYINPMGAMNFAAAPADIGGKYLAQLVPPQTCECMARNAAEVVKTGEQMEFEEKCQFPAGEKRLKLALSPVRDRSGSVRSVYVVSREVSEANAGEFVWNPAGSTEAALPEDSAVPIHVLLVDDDPDSGQAVKTSLEERKMSVTLLPDAEEAVKKFGPDDFDVVVADIRLPGMSGVGLLGHIRKITSDFPVILITGYDSLQTAIEAVRLGAQDYILKPLDSIDNLVMPVQRAVAHHKLTLKSKALERRLKTSEEKWRSLVKSAPNFVAIVDSDGVIQYTNRTLPGKRMEAVLGSKVYDHISGKYREIARETLKQVFEAGVYVAREFEVIGGNGEGIWFEAHVGPIISEGKVIAAAVIASDITSRKQTAQALERSRNNSRLLWSRFVHLEESERKRLARELHDQIGQTLTAISLNMNLIRGGLSPKADAKVADLLKDSTRLIEGMGESIRNVMADLRPPVLDEYGLLAALRWYGGKFASRTGIAVDITGSDPVLRPPIETETSLFRIAQEALNNIVKHAAAGHVAVRLTSTKSMIQMTIYDDGVGFNVETVSQPSEKGGWGLTTMRERAESVGGNFTITSGPGKGTRITVEIDRGKQVDRSVET